MTRADKIKEYVKERYGVELNQREIEDNNFTFRGCDGFDCPMDCAGHRCSKCPYKNFWEQEDNDLYSITNIYKELINTQELIFKIMPYIYDIHTYIKSVDKEIKELKGDNNVLSNS